MNKKDTIYIDIDDDITSIIDKVRSSKEQIVALVLPKRASVFQSTVNMKLLKKVSTQANKKPVLITSEPALLPLAGAAKIHTAPNLQSKPEIPPAAEVPTDTPLAEEDAGEVDMDPSTPIGKAMGEEAEEEAEIDNTPPGPSSTAAENSASSNAKKSSRKPKVPNFKKFRKWIILGGIALVLLIAFIVWAIFFAPKATVTVQTETSDLAKTVDFIADTEADSIDLDNSVLPAMSQELEKTETEEIPATGQEDKGKKASGSVTLKNCSSSVNPVTIPSGTGVSSGGLTYLTKQSVTLPASSFDGQQACTTQTRNVGVTAQESGGQYNSGAKSYSVAGNSGVIASGSAMTGGTTNIVKIVSQEDINRAKELLEAKEEDATGELQEALEDEGYVAIVETLSSNSQFSASPKAGTEASETTVVATMTHTMLGVKEDDLKELIEKSVEEDIDTQTQSVLGFGINEATFAIDEESGEEGVSATMQTTLVIGPELNQEQIKTDIAGKNRDEAEQILRERPGFSDSNIDTSPFWVGSVPTNIEKIDIVIEESDGSAVEE
jgi:hypothetical protein